MTVIAIPQLRGKRPKIKPEHLEVTDAQVAINCDFDHGAADPFHEPSVEQALNSFLIEDSVGNLVVDSGTQQVIAGRSGYMANINGLWISFADTMDVVPSFIDNTDSRYYYTGDATPRQSDYTLTVAGSPPPYPTSYYRLGIPAPATALTYVVNNTAGTTPESTAYVFTYVTVWGEESAPSPTTVNFDVDYINGQTVSLSGFTLLTDSDLNIDAVRIYRINSGLADAEYQFVVEVPVDNTAGIVTLNGEYETSVVFTADAGTDTMTSTGHTLDNNDVVRVTTTDTLPAPLAIDTNYFVVNDAANTFQLSATRGGAAINITDAGTGVHSFIDYGEQQAFYTLVDDNLAEDLGEVLPTIGWIVPPSDLAGLTMISNGVLGGFVGNTLYFSEPYYPYAWPEKYQLTFQDDIVGVGFAPNLVAILTTGSPSMLLGSDPDTLSQQPLPYKQPCVSKRSIVSTDKGIIYASNLGLFLLTASGGEILTMNHYSREQWQALNIDEIIGAYHDNKYFGIFADTNTGFIFNLVTGDWTDLEFADQTISYILSDGYHVYMAGTDNTTSEASAFQWDGGYNFMTLTWKSKKFKVGSGTNFSIGRLQTDGTVTLNLYVDNVLYQTDVSQDEDLFRLGAVSRGREYELEVTGTSDIQNVVIGTSVEEITQ